MVVILLLLTPLFLAMGNIINRKLIGIHKLALALFLSPLVSLVNYFFMLANGDNFSQFKDLLW